MQRYWLALCLCGGMFVAVSVQAAPAEFNATIAGVGTCAITFNPAGTLTLDSTNASTAIDAIVPPILSIKKTTLTFTSCTGWSGGLTPTLTVTGSTSTDNAVMGNKQYLLKSAGAAGGTSRGFGFVMGRGTTGVITWDTGATGIYAFSQPVPLTLAPAGTHITSGISKDLYFGLSCGTSPSCASANVNAGTLNATLTFAFAYK
ncbi:hypothetical protein ACEV60_17840 [Enterobacter ludwigii]|uniref:hypothetical protein n=1 Tax=Enterobacter ludwigii TaxID=299767 RepID=UPI003BEEC7DF